MPIPLAFTPFSMVILSMRIGTKKEGLISCLSLLLLLISLFSIVNSKMIIEITQHTSSRSTTTTPFFLLNSPVFISRSFEPDSLSLLKSNETTTLLF